MKRLGLTLMALVLGGCALRSASTAVPVTPVVIHITLAPTSRPTVLPSPTGPATYQLGDMVTVTKGGQPSANVTVSDVQTVPSYTSKYFTDTPKTAGDVFIQAKVRYDALADGVDYNQFDWKVYCAASLVDTGLLLLYAGPEPMLHSGILPNGRNVSGYVVFEVPPTGEVRMSYGGSFSLPVFEVIIRAA